MSASNDRNDDRHGESLWDVPQAAEYLHMSKSWVYRAVEKNVIPSKRLGGALRFVPAHLRQYAEQPTSAKRGKVINLPTNGRR